ncbi:MAG: hypothetical protein PHU81_08940 [Acidobacteriota bacterium]|nr:hypothetical protein [Acidobacteriota bacterium]
MIPAEEKAVNIKIFKAEGAFYQYLDRLLASQGYVLVVTSPLKRIEQKVSISLTGQGSRKN